MIITTNTGMVHGGAVLHVISTKVGAFGQTISLCGRWITPGSSDARMCKTCARIGGIKINNAPEMGEAEQLIAGCDCFRAEHLSFEVFTRNRPNGTRFVAFEREMFRDIVAAYREGNEYDACWVGTCMQILEFGNLRADDPRSSENTRKGGNGGGNVIDPKNAKPARTPFGGSDKQRDLILSLAKQLTGLSEEIYGESASDFVALFDEEYLNNLNTQAKVRSQIDRLFKLLDKHKIDAAAKRAEMRKAEAKADPAEDGYYMMGNTFVCVKWNRAQTGQYALVWDGNSWEYDGSASRQIMADVRAGKLPKMTPEDAKRFGDLYGQCFKCHRTLTDPESIAQGYGPICGGRMGW